MKDPTRLLDAATSELELQLLRAGADEQPPTAAMQRLADRLGVNTGHSAELTSPARLPPSAAGKLSLLPVGIVTLGLVVAGVAWVSYRAAPPPAPPPISTLARDTPAAARDATARAQLSAAEPSADPASLALEVARIDAVRQLLAADRAKVALSALQDYQRDFPDGVLQQEADVLRVEAHQRAGDRRRARQIGSRFLTDHPDSPHSARVRELLETPHAR